ncbi:pitrilysin family protein [Roseofilum reptotaenium CS-1145]|uniref:Peptidase M16 n=1 Tax=Roseofilum reptotaenium AO1-A TaxID=1925591 RepID=A0A1L9QQ71_9CYAN|nr:pitrilysin family protein [Roseofilum reptotaenium]MDB9520079.1 pitrilysin family protein [Roseofilum reptotaenium CS-1145]OJJ24782.1 peptidase M16 [Roseofilum reptotaenium AO1-A]
MNRVQLTDRGRLLPLNLKKLVAFLLSILVGVYVLGVEPAIALIQDPSEFSIQPYLDNVEKQVKTFRLDNGLRFIVLERHQAPVISFMLYADVGGANEPVSKTGVAHYLEHLAFKGTTAIGTTDYAAEKPLMDELDRLFDQIQAAQANGNTEEAQELQAKFDQINQQASEYIKQNEFGQIVEQFGGVGLNATTSTDATRYFFSLPSNKLELWMSLESERFLDPVFREFYQEKEVILEERRMRTDNSPIGKMIEAFQDAAFKVHPYRQPVIGYEEDLRNLTRQDVKDFFETYYVPNNLIVAIVGDVNIDEVKKLAQAYFGRFPARPTPKVKIPVEPKQTETREVTLELPTQPMYLEGYHRPAGNDRDHAVYDLMGAILSNGRTARLYKSLVEEKQVALSAAGFSGFPGDKYPNLMLFYSLTAPGHTVDEVAEALQVEIERLKTEPVSETELNRVKTQAKASLLGTLDSNSGLASLLAKYEATTGSWRNLFQEVEAIEAVRPQDIQRVAQATFTPENLTIGRLLTASN